MSFVIVWVVNLVVLCLLTFQRNISPQSALKIEAIFSSETMITTCKNTQCHNPDDHNRKTRNNLCGCENLVNIID